MPTIHRNPRVVILFDPQECGAARTALRHAIASMEREIDAEEDGEKRGALRAKLGALHGLFLAVE